MKERIFQIRNGTGNSWIGNEISLTIVDDYVCKEKIPGLADLAEGKSFSAGNGLGSKSRMSKSRKFKIPNGSKSRIVKNE